MHRLMIGGKDINFVAFLRIFGYGYGIFDIIVVADGRFGRPFCLRLALFCLKGEDLGEIERRTVSIADGKCQTRIRSDFN